MSSATFKLLALKAIKGVGPATLREVRDFINTEKSEMISLINKKFPMINIESYTIGEDYARNQLEIADKFGDKIISFLDPEYPNSLKGLANSPVLLYIRGSVDFLNEKTVAVIGTRAPTKHGEKIAERVTKWLCDNNWNIISGLAIGIDTIGHKTCLQTGMRTAAVLAHGLDTLYPKENEVLAQKIVSSGGALISEYPYGVTVRPAQLVQRDKIQAALSAGVVIMQSGEKGGSMHASREIVRYKRPLIIVGQSKLDTEMLEEKAMANLILLSEDNSSACRLMKMNKYPSNLMIKMYSKNEYLNALDALEQSNNVFSNLEHSEADNTDGFQF